MQGLKANLNNLKDESILMKRQRIFFLLYSMNVGGVEKSLVNSISVLPRDKFDIHIGLVHPEGGFLKSLPSDVTIHEIPEIAKHWGELKNPPLETIRMFVTSGMWIKAMTALWIYIVCKLQGSFYWWLDYVLKDTKGILDEFDIAIAYAGPTADIDYYVCKKINAKKRIGWIHFDISKCGIDGGIVKRLYKQYERIFVVSEVGKMIFDEHFPEYKDKTVVFHNVVSPRQIVSLARDGSTFDDVFTGKRILTVGRISQEKGQRIAIQALKLLSDNYPHLRWYFIGEGSDMPNCQNEAEKLGVADQVVFLGTKTNPYAYMRDCDIYVQPSRHEGFCITLAEALCFDNPIVATDFTGAREQLINRDNGFVVGMGAEAIAFGIEKALCASKTTKVRDGDNQDVEKLLSLLD